jgi:hypothetical protein
MAASRKRQERHKDQAGFHDFPLINDWWLVHRLLADRHGQSLADLRSEHVFN